MGDHSKIQWTDATFNPWIGCTKVSAGCDFCYAELMMDKRYGRVVWGHGNARARTSEANWRLPLKWSREHWQCDGCEKWFEFKFPVTKTTPCPNCSRLESLHERRRRVFCSSLADVFDTEVPIEWLRDVLDLIHKTPWLDWLLLTKRPAAIMPRIQAAVTSVRGTNDQFDDMLGWASAWICGTAPSNVWLGTSIENQKVADARVPELLKVPAIVRFLSCEPLLGAVDLRHIQTDHVEIDALVGTHGVTRPHGGQNAAISWVICGGESGPNARPMHPDWARSLRDQCQTAGVPYFFKQWGAWLPMLSDETMHYPKASFYEWPADRLYAANIGKHAAGRLLDGRTWDELPELAR